MLPWDRPLTNVDITHIVEQTCLKDIFRGAFSRDELTTLKKHSTCNRVEAGIINLSTRHEKGTHWTAWFKHPNNVACYYDSFGDLLPPTELVSYLTNCNIYYNIERDQQFNSVICGQLCLCFIFREYSEIYSII